MLTNYLNLIYSKHYLRTVMWDDFIRYFKIEKRLLEKERGDNAQSYFGPRN